MAFLSGTTIVIYCPENAIANVAISAAPLIAFIGFWLQSKTHSLRRGCVDQSTTPGYRAIKRSQGIEAVRIEMATAMSNQSDFSISCSRWGQTDDVPDQQEMSSTRS